MTNERHSQDAYDVGHIRESADVDSDIMRAMYLYLKHDLGLPEEFCRSRAASELDRGGPQVVIRELSSKGIDVHGQSVLDLGAGLGAMSEELVLQGANTFAIEPGASWASLANRRASRHGVQYDLRRSVGESLPFDDESMDLVVSLQVLEHVQEPERVLSEVARVLKPGGYFYLACENYLAFKEGHYKVFWLPLLPKSVGSVYLRLRGRSPKFLLESVTYVTFPQVISWTRRLGFVRCRDERISDIATITTGPIGYVMRLINTVTKGRAAPLADRAQRAFRFGIRELFYKPPNA